MLEKFDDPNQIIGNITIAEDDTFVIDKTKITSKQSFSLLPDTDTLTPSGITITSVPCIIEPNRNNASSRIEKR